MFKMLSVLFVALQCIIFQAHAEREAHIAYTSAWTGGGIASGLNNELNLAQAQAYKEGKFFELVDISIAPEWGYAYILYNLIDKEGETNSMVIGVAYVDAWSGGGIAEKLQNKINELQNQAFIKNKLIDIKDIKLTPEWGYGYIIYEMSK